MFQIVNLEFNIFDKTGTSLTGGPVANNALWDGFGGRVRTRTTATRSSSTTSSRSAGWSPSSPSEQISLDLECFAVSVTSDPTRCLLPVFVRSSAPSSTTIRSFRSAGCLLPDGPAFEAASGFQGGGVAFDRTAMLAGDPATAIYFDINDIYGSDSFLAADLRRHESSREGDAGIDSSASAVPTTTAPRTACCTSSR